MSKISPQPWRRYWRNVQLNKAQGKASDGSEYAPDNIVDADGKIVCSITNAVVRSSGAGVTIANAHLIAAAPELYEAVALVLGQPDTTKLLERHDREALLALRTAFAHAAGAEEWS